MGWVAYHTFTKSIAGFSVFRSDSDYQRMLGLLEFYKIEKPPTKYSRFMELKDREIFHQRFCADKEPLVDLIAYCLMPTHLHLILVELKEKGVSIYMANVLNSYTRYFNLRINRKGPLWQSRFKRVEIKDNEQLYHLTRYVHLNPVSDNLVESPEEWRYSSYREFIELIDEKDGICNFRKYMDIKPEDYREFVLSRVEHQKEISRIKEMLRTPRRWTEVSDRGGDFS